MSRKAGMISVVFRSDIRMIMNYRIEEVIAELARGGT